MEKKQKKEIKTKDLKTDLFWNDKYDKISVKGIGGRNKMAVSVARVKPLEGKEASKFWEALKTSKIRKEAISKAEMVKNKGFKSK